MNNRSRTLVKITEDQGLNWEKEVWAEAIYSEVMKGTRHAIRIHLTIDGVAGAATIDAWVHKGRLHL